ncbi:unnamed protein product [Cylicocyclus nassatus]|uniref:Uncharacterized protein n=1 Tax=Cylicocyclus nassatus TaxID=53992 RepID=A0AA36DSR9_CYLNA|nr:unnamed protein product [Cylicocyclus nassatus]
MAKCIWDFGARIQLNELFLDRARSQFGGGLGIVRYQRGNIFVDAKRKRAGETAAFALDAGLDRIVEMIEACFESTLVGGTLKIYKRVQKKFLKFAAKFRTPLAALHKLRNVFIAHLIEKRRLKALRYHVAALSHFSGPLPQTDEKILRALLRSARTTPAVKHRKKVTPKDVDKVITRVEQEITIIPLAENQTAHLLQGTLLSADSQKSFEKPTCKYAHLPFVRGGAATPAIRAGIHPSNLMRAGRWRIAEAFANYN